MVSIVSQTLKIWLLDLEEVGVDLVQYGVKKRDLLLADEVRREFLVNIGDWEGAHIELIGFTYGPRPED